MMRIAAVCLLVVPAHACFAQATPGVPKRNLVTFFSKCRTGGPVTVAYIGGSITAADGWRPFTTKWLQEQFKGVEIKEVNAAIGGTGSMLGVFRLQKHVLQYDPDLAFVEFAVNDNKVPDDSVHATIEGIVRQCWAREKKPDLVFTYTTAHKLDIPTNRHQDVADAYGIPTVDFQKPIQALCLSGLIDWEVLAADRVHPGAWGHSIYAATLATYLKQQMALTEAVPPPDTLPEPVYSGAYQTARLETVADRAPEGWQVVEPAGMFRDGSIMANEVGQSVELKFTGTMVGLYYEIRKDAGFILPEIDGKAYGPIDTSWGPTYKFNRQNSTMIASDLTPGEHTLKLTVTDKKPELSEGHEFHLGYLMVAG
ncbi:MAG: SGNH/GDSL hydrolase family protein [Armatimonadetes bacterium]|nr:SGNH/GDSL hydrolase family protein [Armatimonadota bacterium]